MTFNYLKTNSTKFAHYRLKIRKVIEFCDFQSLMQHPLCDNFSSNIVQLPFKYCQKCIKKKILNI